MFFEKITTRFASSLANILHFLLFLLILSSCGIHQCADQTDDSETFRIDMESYQSSGDKAKIEGTFYDSKTKEALPFVQIKFHGKEGVYGAISDENGKFIINKMPFGDYNVEISLMDYGLIRTTFHVEFTKSYRLKIYVKYTPIHVEKPVVYFYPTKRTDLTVRLDYQGEIIHSYPIYPKNGWRITADSNGTLWDENGKEYYALFWEGKPLKNILPTDGFVVPGGETATFLEEKLAYLGLNRREANEFIMYWLPRMEKNPFNLIHFSGADYEQQAPLEILPQPETCIRVMMLTKPLTTKINFPLQDLSPLKKERKGFTVVEWGGSELNDIGM